MTSSIFSIRLGALAMASALLAMGLGACDRGAPASQQTTSPAKSAAQAKPLAFTITGSVPEMAKEGKVVKLYLSGQAPYDIGDDKAKPIASGVVKNGQFSLSGTVKEPAMAVLLLNDENAGLEMILEQGDYKVASFGPDIGAQGSPIHDMAYGFEKQADYVQELAKLNAAQDAMFAEKYGTPEQERLQTKFSEQQQVLAKIRHEYEAKVIDGDAPPMTKLFVLRNNQDMERYNFDKRLALLDTLEKALGQQQAALITKMRKQWRLEKQMAENQAAMKVGGKYVEVTAKDKDGKAYQLSDSLAKHDLVLLEFWASWCGPCREEIPNLVKVRNKHAGKLEIFAVSTDQDRDAWLKALREESAKHDIGWLQLFDGGEESASANAYGVEGIPDNYLIARDGTLLGKQLYGDALDKAVIEYLKKSAKKG